MADLLRQAYHYILIIFVVLLAILLIKIVIIKIIKERKEKNIRIKIDGVLRNKNNIGFDDIDKMNGLEFERFVQECFKKLGYKTEKTEYYDYGIDLIIEKDKIRTGIQVKRNNGRVGQKAIQQVVSAKKYYKCDKLMVVTNSNFNNRSYRLAAVNDVELMSREKLKELIIRIRDFSRVLGKK